jgi:hypothetical protein
MNQPTVKLKSATIMSFPYFAYAKEISHIVKYITWWVWSLGSSNNLWTTRRSLESLLLHTDLSAYWSIKARFLVFLINLLPMVGLQIFLKKYALVRTHVAFSIDGSSTRVASHSHSMSTMLFQAHHMQTNSGCDCNCRQIFQLYGVVKQCIW